MKNELNRSVDEYRRTLTIPSADQIRMRYPELHRQAVDHHERFCNSMEGRNFNFLGVFLQSQLIIENALHSLLKELKEDRREMRFVDMIKRLNKYEQTDDIVRVLTSFRKIRNKLVHQVDYLPTEAELLTIIGIVFRSKQFFGDESAEDPYSAVGWAAYIVSARLSGLSMHHKEFGLKLKCKR